MCKILAAFLILVVGYLIFELVYVCSHGSPYCLDKLIDRYKS